MMNLLRQGVQVITLVLVALLACAPVASAEPNGDQTYEECISRQYDAAAARQLVKDGVADLATYGGAGKLFGSNDGIQRMKEDHPEEFERLRKHYQDDQGLGSKAGRTANSATCNALKPLESIVGDYWEDPVGKFVKALIEGNAQTLQTVMTFWMDFSTAQTKNVDANIQGVKNIVTGLAATALVASFVIGGYRIAASRRMGLQDGIEETAGVVVKYLVFSFAVVGAVPGALVASDALADSIMKNFGVTDPNQVVEMAGLSENMAGPIIIMLLALVSLAGGLVQLIALMTRVLILPIVVGLTPLAAASSFSETGRSMLNSLMAFMIACVAYKPLAALLYAVVMWNATQPGEDDLIGAAINVLMIALAGFCAPALIRVIAPMTAAAGGGGAAPVLGAAGAGASAALGMGAKLAGGGAAALAASAAKGAAGAPGGGSSGVGGGSGPGSSPSGGGGGRSGAPSTSASPSGSSGGSSKPSGASGGGGVSTASAPAGSMAPGRNSQSAQPQSARTRANSGFGGRMGSMGARAVAGAGRGVVRGASVAERIGALGLSGAAHGMNAAARAAQTGSTAANHTQRILDDSIGVNGYAGGRHQ